MSLDHDDRFPFSRQAQMIRFALKCSNDHGFESWFQSGEAFGTLQKTGRVSCPTCGSVTVEKALMAPAVRAEKAEPLAKPQSPVEKALAALRRQIEENSDYVGMNFAAEARAIHEGEAVARSIYGEAKPEEARALLEEGIRVAPLPFLPPRKVN